MNVMMYYLAHVSEIAAMSVIGLISVVIIFFVKRARTQCLTQSTYSAHTKPAVLIASMPASQCRSIDGSVDDVLKLSGATCN
jgi:hypothetical protein